MMETASAVLIAILFLVSSANADESKLRVACEGEDLMHRVKCHKENHGMQIETANFGRDDAITCQPVYEEQNENSTKDCGLKNVKEIIRPFCEGKQRCDSFIANTANLGEPEKCRNVRKFLRMYVECVRISDPDEAEKPRVQKASKNKDMTIINIQDTSGTHFVQYDQVHDSSSLAKPVALFMLVFLGVFCTLFY